MRKLLTVLAAALLWGAPVFAQGEYVDARGRVTSTIVADVLAQMPAKSESQWLSDMSDLVQSAPGSIVALAAFLPDQAARTGAEYALKGVSDYVSAGNAGGEKVREGLVSAIGAAGDPVAKAFLVSVLAPVATKDEAVLLQGLTSDPVCGPYAVSALEGLGVLVRPAVEEPSSDAAAFAAAIGAIDAGGPGIAVKALRKALKSDDRALRVASLDAATEKFGTGMFLPTVSKLYKKLSDPAKADILYWAGDNKVDALLGEIVPSVGAEGEIADAAIYAASKIGGDEAIHALVGQIGGSNSDKAVKALSAVHGDVEGAVKEAVTQMEDPATLASLLSFAGQKRLHGLFDEAAKYASDADGALKSTALEALAGVSAPDNADRLAAMLEAAPADDVPALQRALSHSVSTMPEREGTDLVKSYMDKGDSKALYFPVLALVNTDPSVSTLRWYFEKAGSTDARASLLEVDNISVVPDIQKAVKEGGPMTDTYIKRYLRLQSKETNPGVKRDGIDLAIRTTDDIDVKADAIGRLGRMYDPVSFAYAGQFLDNENLKLRYTAAKSVRDIAAHTADIKPDDLEKYLGKAKEVFAANGTLDDGYAVKQIDKLLSDRAPVPLSRLTEEEESAGFEMLFDGSDLSKWEGDLEGYSAVNGTIYVSAGFGTGGNLYTKKEYRNFVYRFEFCFLRPGINNGVGIRTPEGVDAAYEGMCEVQILDHDAPAYAYLREFQVHGSAYGLVPAKRITHKQLGQWSTEEIVVEGDHIKVTVNGEVVTDANLREACQGYNVAPDGGKSNPYTLDRHNHPGMFNERGHISFCGHGEGLKIRNVRILELPD